MAPKFHAFHLLLSASTFSVITYLCSQQGEKACLYSHCFLWNHWAIITNSCFKQTHCPLHQTLAWILKACKANLPESAMAQLVPCRTHPLTACLPPFQLPPLLLAQLPRFRNWTTILDYPLPPFRSSSHHPVLMILPPKSLRHSSFGPCPPQCLSLGYHSSPGPLQQPLTCFMLQPPTPESLTCILWDHLIKFQIKNNTALLWSHSLQGKAQTPGLTNKASLLCCGASPCQHCAVQYSRC